MPRTGELLKNSLKMAIGVALVVFVFSKVQFSDLLEALSQAAAGQLFMAFLFFGLSRIFEALRLYVFTAGRNISTLQTLEIVFVSTFFNNFVTTMAGDGYKVLSLGRQIESWEDALSMIVIERLMGLTAIVGIAIFLFVAYPDRFEVVQEAGAAVMPITTWDIAVVISSVVLIVALIVYAFRGKARIAAILASFNRLVVEFQLRQWTVAFLLTIIAQVMLAAMVYELVVAFGGSIGFEENLLVMLLVYIAAYVPITIGSLGVREGAIVMGLSLFSISHPIALAAALVSRAIIYVYGAAAGAWWAVRKQ